MSSHHITERKSERLSQILFEQHEKEIFEQREKEIGDCREQLINMNENDAPLEDFEKVINHMIMLSLINKM